MPRSRRHETHHYTNPDTIVQDHRFVILEDFGCQAAVYDSLPALIIVWLPPLCISIIGILFCRKSIHQAYHNCLSNISRDKFPRQSTSARATTTHGVISRPHLR